MRTVPTSPSSAEATAACGATQRFQNFLGGFHQGLARGCQPTERVLRSNNVVPKLALQLLDRPAQRRLRDMQTLSGATEVQFLGDGEKATDVD